MKIELAVVRDVSRLIFQWGCTFFCAVSIPALSRSEKMYKTHKKHRNSIKSRTSREKCVS